MQILPMRSAWMTLALCVLIALAGCGPDDNSADPARGAQKHALSARSGRSASPNRQPLVSGLPDFSRLIKQVSPAVVNVSALPPRADHGQPSGGASTGRDDALGQWLRRFFGGEQNDGSVSPPPQLPDNSRHVSLGSGFVISPNGYILTNRHVIAGAGRIVVKLSDRRQLIAKIVGADRDSDIAVLKVRAKNLPTVRIGDPNKLDVGAWVIAIGSPFGFETSVTAGIVSAKGRSLSDDRYVPFLQTDVAINPGNSGGPLFNLAGEVVGVNSQIYSQTGGYQGIAFAIPIDIAMNVARQLRQTGRVTRGWLGVQIQDVDRGLAKTFKLKRPEGALISQVLKHSPAAGADLHAGDVILALNGHPIDSASDLPPLAAAITPGSQARLKILRNGHIRTRQIKIGALPARLGGGPKPRRAPRQTPFGLTLQPLTDKQRQALGLDRGGVRVTHVAPGPAAEAGLQAGDVILSVGSIDIQGPKSMRKALDKADGPLALLVVRNGVRRYLPIQASAAGG